MTSISIQALAALLASTLYLAFTLLILRRKSISRTGRDLNTYFLALAGWFLLAGLWHLGWLPQTAAFDRLPGVALPLVALALLHTSRRFLRRPGLDPLAWLTGAGLTLILALVDFTQPENTTLLDMPIGILVSNLFTGFWALITGISVFVVLANYQARPHPLHRNRITYWAFVLIMAALAGLSFLLANLLITVALYGLSSVLAAYVVLTHRQPDIRLGSLRVLGYFLTTLILMLIYAIMFWVTQFVMQARLGYPPYVAAIANALFLAILFRPLFNRIQIGVDTLLGRVDFDLNQTIREYSLRISNILELEELAGVILDLISEALESRRSILFAVDLLELGPVGSQYQLRAVRGSMQALPGAYRLASDSPLAGYLSTERQPLIQYDIDLLDRFQVSLPSEREWFSQLGMDVYVPIYSKNTWIGLLAIGPKVSGVPYSNADLGLLSVLADQTSVALENARLVEGLVQVNMELEAAYESLNKSTVELERMDQAKSDFISIASHELRTPLTVIQGYTQMMRDDPLVQDSEYHRKLIEGIISGAGRLHQIIESMLDVAKIDNRDLKLSPIPLSISTVMQNVSRRLAPAAESRRLQLEIQDLTHLPPVQADREAIQKVFFHLLGNAIKYTPDGGKISVSCNQVQDNQDGFSRPGLEVIVADTGIGIEPENQELIFQKFYRIGELGLHSSGETKFMGAGTGLGLAIARGVVGAHGGRIWVESSGCDEEQFPGSRFHVYLPFEQPR